MCLQGSRSAGLGHQVAYMFLLRRMNDMALNVRLQDVNAHIQGQGSRRIMEEVGLWVADVAAAQASCAGTSVVEASGHLQGLLYRH